MTRRVAYLTGTRAEYGLMRSTLDAIQAHPELDLVLLVTGQHLVPEFGSTVREIEADGYPIAARVSTVLGEDTVAAMPKSLGLALLGIAQVFESILPDVVLVEGDRGEMLAAAAAAAHMNIPVVHHSGGDRSGSIDDRVRDAITAFAHFHLATTKRSADQLTSMGVPPERVQIIGEPGLRDIVDARYLPRPEVARLFSLNLREPLLVVVQHPVTTEADWAAFQMRETLEAVKALGLPTVVVYPNADAGGRSMIAVIEEYADLPFLQTHKHISRLAFLGLLKVATALVGNSSAGLIEAPSFGLPAINLGSRQTGREQGANVLDVAHNRKAITAAVRSVLDRPAWRDELGRVPNPYGDGRTDERIAQFLATFPVTRLDEKSGADGQR